MALVRYGQPTDGLDQGIRSIGNVFAQMPRIQAQAGLVGAQTERERALAKEALSRAGESDVKSKAGQAKIDQAATLGRIFSQPGAISREPNGRVSLSPEAEQALVSSIPQMADNAGDLGSGIGRVFTSMNANSNADLDRASRETIAEKPVALNPNQTLVSTKPEVAGVDPETGDPSTTGGIGRVIAIAPPAPQQSQRPLPDYTTTTVDDIKNPAYDISSGATNVPPMIKKTNVTQRVSGMVKPPSQVQPAPELQKRQKDTVYATPKGNLKWTGTGWVQP